jgi:hypothetical protein
MDRPRAAGNDHVIGEPLREQVLAAFAPSGAFQSIAHLPSGPVADQNAFVTALVLDQVEAFEADRSLVAVRQRAVDFLRRCERSTGSGRFGFYPDGAQPAWIAGILPPDTDDTALCSLALFRAGHWQKDDLRRQVHEVLDVHRLAARPSGADWYRAGIYPTWMDSRRMRNPIDVCVNVNALILIEVSGIGRRHGSGILDMLAAALDWAGSDQRRARSITPYYPHPGELMHTLARAVSAGVDGAKALLERVQAQPWSACEDWINAPVCGALGGGMIWTCPLLQALRRSRLHNRLIVRYNSAGLFLQ